MSDIETIKRLRESTGIGLTDAKNALVESGGDYDKALESLRVKGLARADKKAERDASAGIIHSYVHGSKIGVLLELNCETDFVARTDDFKTLANDLALHIAASAPRYVRVDDIEQNVVEKEKELLAAEVIEAGKPAEVVDKIVDGKLAKFFEEVCLLNQPFVKDPNQTVEELIKSVITKLGENIVIRRFVRLELGQKET